MPSCENMGTAWIPQTLDCEVIKPYIVARVLQMMSILYVDGQLSQTSATKWTASSLD